MLTSTTAHEYRLVHTFFLSKPSPGEFLPCVIELVLGSLQTYPLYELGNPILILHLGLIAHCLDTANVGKAMPNISSTELVHDLGCLCAAQVLH